MHFFKPYSNTGNEDDIENFQNFEQQNVNQSLLDFAKTKKIENQIFECIHTHPQSDYFKHLTVKRQRLDYDESPRVVLQLIDTSSKVLLDQEKAEKVIMSMVNATVSHEIRNPINSIHCQNKLIELLIKKMEDLVDYLVRGQLSIEVFLSKLSEIKSQVVEALAINISSEKLVSFLIEDFLDLAQVRTGNFRKIISTFEASQPFDEVVSILSYKAKHKRVGIEINFENLEPNELIRTDKRRIMQVMLNLLSNALKFTSNDGKIDINCRKISNQAEFRRYEQPHHKLAAFCTGEDMLEVCVKDSGTGIQPNDMDRLFQLYGFIQATQEINTGGIGLGLHISRKIIRQLGGEITCDSEWGVGTEFTFVVKLTQRSIFGHEEEGEIRTFNPYHRRSVSQVDLQEELKLLSDTDESVIPIVQLGNGGTFVDRTLPS